MTNPTAAILVIGDEILSGRTRDSNMHFLAQELTRIGITLREGDVRMEAQPDGTARIVGLARSGDGVLRVDVSDRGPGIPEDERARIFDMFYSVERGDRGRQGTGLGLAICRRIVGHFGGRLWVESEPGRGSVFSFDLPAAAAGGGAGRLVANA